ncbi:MAG TPA: peptidyl-alpha-hydroxyglycine alpha-amidating lyase family protein [Dehalococcoidia bacterium]|nr:peptidylglycine alpha-amidating monooxygenase [Dehalococcoidia bacterium]HJM54538.1 peptidyl-alpha-hydroxyglycine alpha-amidating lyase family protein [Dehalococcoidia bacterium]
MPQGPATSETVYKPVPLWGSIPQGIWFQNTASLAVDGDRVYVFNRGNRPVIILDTAGNYIDSWGEGMFNSPHGITVAPDGNLFLTDNRDHVVHKTDKAGNVIFTLGTPGEPCEWQSGGMFNRPTNVAVQPSTGVFFVSDGYGNSRVHKFDPDGTHITSWGEPGTGPGQFSLPHNIQMIGDDRVAVCDRENFRVQVFTTEGEFIDQWRFHRPMAICAGKGDDTNLYIGEAGPPSVQVNVPGLGLQVVVIGSDGQEVNRFGRGTSGEEPDQFSAPHGISTDSDGNVYVAEVTAQFNGNYGWAYDRQPVTLRKWARVSG